MPFTSDFLTLCTFFFFFFNDTATTEIYTLSLHDALPISACEGGARARALRAPLPRRDRRGARRRLGCRAGDQGDAAALGRRRLAGRPRRVRLPAARAAARARARALTLLSRRGRSAATPAPA